MFNADAPRQKTQLNAKGQRRKDAKGVVDPFLAFSLNGDLLYLTSILLNISGKQGMPVDKARIIAMGSYLPERVLNNFDLEKIVDTSDEWITSRTGIQERHIAAPGEYASCMGAKAATRALQAANMSPDQVDLIIVATMTPDYLAPSTAALIQASIGATKAVAFDTQAACAGFIYGLSIAKAFIESHQYKNVLLIATEKMSAIVDYQDRNTCVLFGDGAAAVLITNHGTGLVINNVCLGTDGCVADLLLAPGGAIRTPPTEESVTKRSHFLKMSGSELFKHAVRRMEQAATECLSHASLQQSDIAWLIPHQANARIIDALSKKFEIPSERVYRTLHKYGNTSASSVAIALHELTETEKIAKDEHLLLVAFGAGLTWGATVLTQN